MTICKKSFYICNANFYVDRQQVIAHALQCARAFFVLLTYNIRCQPPCGIKNDREPIYMNFSSGKVGAVLFCPHTNKL